MSIKRNEPAARVSPALKCAESVLRNGPLVQQESFVFIKDDSCFRRSTHIDKMIWYENQLDKADARIERFKSQRDFRSKIVPEPLSQEQLARRREKNGRKRGSREFVPICIRAFNPEIFYDWVQHEVELTYEDIEHYIRSLTSLSALLPDIPFDERLQCDPVFAYEIERGDWDL